DVGVFDRRADAGARDSALVPIGHTLQVHTFLMVSAVIVNEGRHGDAVMRRCPQYAGAIHQISVALDIHRESAELLISKTGAHGLRRAMTFAGAPRAADKLVILIEIPQSQRPAAYEAYVRDQGPILVLNGRPDFSGHARRSDGARVPPVGCFGTGSLERFGVGVG